MAQQNFTIATRPHDLAGARLGNVAAEFATRLQIREFIRTLYPERSALVQVSAVEKWCGSSGRKHNRHVHTAFIPANQVEHRTQQILDTNLRERANIFFGVAPRDKPVFGKQAISVIPSLWCDLDHCSLDMAIDRFQTCSLPNPSALVCSGTGIHAYWVLDEPYEVRRFGRDAFEWALRILYQDLGTTADASVCDCSRLLRLPATLNQKNARNGLPPTRCELLDCDASRKYSLKLFRRYFYRGLEQRRASIVAVEPSAAPEPTVPDDAWLMARDFAKPVRDRSARDMRLMCDLLRSFPGLTDEQLLSLCAGTGKFQERRDYGLRTIAAARCAIQHELR